MNGLRAGGGPPSDIAKRTSPETLEPVAASHILSLGAFYDLRQNSAVLGHSPLKMQRFWNRPPPKLGGFAATVFRFRFVTRRHKPDG